MTAQLDERERVIHLLNRATYGARLQDLGEVLRIGRAAWLDRQLRPETIPDHEFVRSSGRPPSELASTSMALEEAVLGLADGTPESDEARARIARRRGASLSTSASKTFLGDPVTVAGMTTIKIARATYSERQLEEVMTDFWFNHFNVDARDSTEVQRLVYDYQERAIRPFVFGRFEDMLLATAHHPAMMLYLDNAFSTAPNALPFGDDPYQKLPERPGGLNENYARELMELHTLGVDGGYTQQDVTELARVLTGWSTDRNGGVTLFRFWHARHDRGAKVLLGHALRAGRAQEEGLEVLHLLATHSSTAEFLATKLVRHFVADEPPAALVAELARVFRETSGDLREVTRALFLSEGFYESANYRAKVKRPFEFIASTLRVTNADVDVQVQLTSLVTQLRIFQHLPYSAQAPTGYPITAEDWVGASAMLERLNFTLEVLGGGFVGVVVDRGSVGGDLQRTFEASVTSDQKANAILRWALLDDGGRDAASLRPVLADEISRQKGEAPDRFTQLLGLALGSPAFQRY